MRSQSGGRVIECVGVFREDLLVRLLDDLYEGEELICNQS